MFFTFEFLCLSYFVSFVFCFYSIYAVCIRRSTDETSNTKNTVTHQWATKWPSSTFLKLKVTQTRYGGIYGVQIGDSHCAHLIDEKEIRRSFCPLEPKHLISVIGNVKSYSFGAL